MPNRSPYGNLTAVLVVVAFLELAINRLLGRLFVSPGCHTGLGCLLLATGPFLRHLTGALTLVVCTGGIVGHLRRGELFPRGMRLTVAVLSLTFLGLLALSLAFGRIPDRYQTHLETSFGFAVGLLVLSFIGADAVPVQRRVGFLLFALPPLFHVASSVAGRAGWLRQGVVTPERLTAAGEMILLLAAMTAPLLLVPRMLPRTRWGAAVALAAGVSGFFFVAFLGRTDLVQTVALYGVQLELPRPLTWLGALYVLALFGYVTSVAMLVLSRGAARLVGLGMALVGLAGYQTSSPVALGLSLCGLVALATGTVRGGRSAAKADLPLSIAAWQALLEGIAVALGDARPAADEPALIEVTASDASDEGAQGTTGDRDTGLVKVRRRGRPVEVTLRRFRTIVREIEVTVGTPPVALPDATIETHEAWLGRRPEDRLPLARMKTGDAAFDRKLGVHGHAPVREPGMRRRLLRLADGTIHLWTGRAARFSAPGNPTEGLRRFTLTAGAASVAAVEEVADTLIDLLEVKEDTTPSDAA